MNNQNNEFVTLVKDIILTIVSHGLTFELEQLAISIFESYFNFPTTRANIDDVYVLNLIYVCELSGIKSKELITIVESIRTKILYNVVFDIKNNVASEVDTIYSVTFENVFQ